MSFDYGYSHPFSVGWWAMDPAGCLYRYKEWYGCEKGRANIGLKLTPQQIAEGIIQREADEIRDNVKVIRIADPSIFDRSRGESVAQMMEPNSQGKPGVYFEPGDKTRLAGKMQVHERMRFDENGRPRMQVFSTCTEFIRTIPTLPYSMTKVEDVDTDAEDHIYDEMKYCFMEHPLPTAPKPKSKAKKYDPYTEHRRH